MEWFNILKLWTFATQPDAVSRRNRARALPSSGVTSPDVIPDIRADGSFWGGGRGQVIRLRDSTDFIDLSSVTNRQSRYKEYERLRNTVEIETAMDVYSDEMCVGGDTVVMTPTGPVTIAKLAETRRPEEMFMVYSYDFSKKDFVIGWGFNPRKIGIKKTIQIVFSDGSTLTSTDDHKVLMRDGTWVEAGKLKLKDEVMAFYRARPQRCERRYSGKHREYRYARIFTFNEGFKNERQMIDEFRTGKKTHHAEIIDKIMRCIANGLTTRQTGKFLGLKWATLDPYMESEGISQTTIKKMYERFPDKKRVIAIDEGPETDVYDMSVKEHRNFCTDSAVVHNCQIGDNGHMFEIKVKNPDIKDELEELFFRPEKLNVDREMFSWCKNLLIFGDLFFELIMDPENPQDGVARLQPLPPDSVYRIETIKGKLIEFQQSKSGPDYEALSKVEVTRATDFDLMQSQAIRFSPQQLIHIRIGDERRTFYPYGVSLIEPARGPAHLLRLLEDALVVYRLCLSTSVKLPTPNGIKEIGKIKVGDTVYSYENKKLIPSKVISVTHYPPETVFNVKTRRRTICANATHPFLVSDNGVEKYVSTKELIAGKSQLVVAPAVLESTPKRIDCRDSKFGNLPEFVDERFAKLFGFLIGDGHFDKKNIRATIAFADNFTKYYADLMKHYFGSTVFVEDKLSKRIHSITRILENLGYDAKNKQLPDWIFSERPEIRKAMVRGLCDAAANKGKYNCLVMRKKFPIEQVKFLWESIGLKCSKIDLIKCKEDCRRIYLFDSPKDDLETVISVETKGQEEVVDISVDNRVENFVAEGVLVHNSRAPERRIFYIDVGGLPPFKAEMVMKRIQDTLRKNKTFSNKGGGPGAGAGGVEERFQPIGQDEDLFVPIRPNVNTRVETLPGAQSLGEVDDVKMFRDKLFLALKFPKWYMSQEDPSTTRDKLSALSMTICNHVKRLQNHVADGMMQIAVRHLELRGFPAELFDDLQIHFTEPYPIRDIVLNDIRDAKYNRAMALMQSQIFSHYDVLTKILDFSENDAKEVVARMNAQKMTDLRLQMMAANPEWMGVVAKPQLGTEMGTDNNGPNPELQAGNQPTETTPNSPAPEQQETKAEDTYGNLPKPETFKFPEPSEEDIKRFDLGIIDYSSGIDSEDLDFGELDDEPI